MRRHALTDSDFVDLGAGRPSPGVIDELRRGQHGRNLLLLRGLPDEGHPEYDITDPLFGAWAAARLRNRVTGPAPADRPAVRFLTAEHDKITISVRLDDRDDRRGLLGLTPSAPLTDAEAAHWQECLTEAWRLLVTRHRTAAHQLADVLTCIVPVESDAGAAGISATSADAFGAVAMSRPADATGLAVGLLHETQHSLLNATAYLFDLHEDPRAPGYSPWRDDPRPTSGILHGAYAYLAVTRFWRTESRATGDPLATFEFCRWREAVATTAERLLAKGRLTAAGRRFTGALLDEVRPWSAEPADPRITHLARLANDDHYVRWRLRNMRPDPAALLTAYHRGDPPPPVASRLVTGDGRALSHSPRLREIHALLRRDGSPVDNSAELSDPRATFTPTQRGGGGGGGHDPRKIKNRGEHDDARRTGATTPPAGRDPAADPGRDPATDPRRDPATDPRRDPATDPKPDPATDPGRDPSGDARQDLRGDARRDPAADTGPDPAADARQDPRGDARQDPGTDTRQDPGGDARQDAASGEQTSASRQSRETRATAVEAALLAGDYRTVRHAYTGKDFDLELTALVIAGGVGARAEEVAALVAAGSDAVAVVDWIVG